MSIAPRNLYMPPEILTMIIREYVDDSLLEAWTKLRRVNYMWREVTEKVIRDYYMSKLRIHVFTEYAMIPVDYLDFVEFTDKYATFKCKTPLESSYHYVLVLGRTAINDTPLVEFELSMEKNQVYFLWQPTLYFLLEEELVLQQDMREKVEREMEKQKETGQLAPGGSSGAQDDVQMKKTLFHTIHHLPNTLEEFKSFRHEEECNFQKPFQI